jgi:predicted nicotinamide N-methyase
MVENRILVSNFAHKILQKWLRNLASQSETIVFGAPCKRTISQKTNQQNV